MNHKVLFSASLLVVVIGAAGLIFHQKNGEQTSSESVVTEQAGDQSIVVALTSKPIEAGTLLHPDDFSLKTVLVPRSSDLIKHDISGIKSLNGYLVTANIAENSYISPDMLESPDSPTFMAHSLKAGEVAYRLVIKSGNAYLLDSFNRGDTVSLYLRTLATDKNKKLTDGVTLESAYLHNIKNQQYVLTAIIKNIDVLDIKRYEKNDADNNANSKQDGDDGSLGYISIRISPQDIKKIHTIERAGDILLIPTTEDDGDEIDMNEVLPNLRTFKELRG